MIVHPDLRRCDSSVCPLISYRDHRLTSCSVRSILITRMIFNLRGVFLTSHKTVSPVSASTTTTFGTTVDFARSIFGNLAAPLSVSYDEDTEDEAGDDSNDDDSIAPSVNPPEDCDSISEYPLKDNRSLSYSPTSVMSKKTLSTILGDSEKGYVCYGDRHGIVVVDIRYG